MPRNQKLPALTQLRYSQMNKDAIALIEEAAQEPSLDELARRARQVLALAAPTEAEERDLIAYWRAQRASWTKAGVKAND